MATETVQKVKLTLVDSSDNKSYFSNLKLDSTATNLFNFAMSVNLVQTTPLSKIYKTTYSELI